MQHPPDHLQVPEGAGSELGGPRARHLAGGVRLHSRAQRLAMLPRCFPPVASVILAFLAALMVLLPVNYRAETGRARPQSPFQVWIDTVTGNSHYPDGAVPAAAASVDPLAAAASPLLLMRPPAGDAGPLWGDASVSERPDAVESTHLHVPMSPGVIIALGIAAMVVAVADNGRLPRQRECRRVGVPRFVDPPPPRLAPC